MPAVLLRLSADRHEYLFRFVSGKFFSTGECSQRTTELERDKRCD
jgi:hypothetical protein